ncbi:MAG: hypothetical protein OEX04_20870 [Acidimicrobiia bacterium]|nr:hypothetical protein [Acidimicrobiia bacterium]
MRSILAVVLVAITGCAGEVSSVPTTVAVTTSVTSDTTTSAPTQDCGSVPYRVGELPERVVSEEATADEIPQDQFTTLPGTTSRLWFDGEGDPAVVLVRGALPPIDWPGEKGEVFIDGARGVAGPLDDGTWMVAWFEGQGQGCDQFFMIFYPPVEPSEVERTIASLNRTAG